ncbi:hypothetical protein RQP53_03685 [Paucibacter sp. APW11]|uniref:Uncharacterized protein n=1 Tax=Roseateles aquae TaxID=3077235 RepID=A0ABU3P733_9BURK|nr:hypothetical protein [Paucibacter sp. APW11]MDT8998375.1 hypothetical protein [Paucibacter sp. APW11]
MNTPEGLSPAADFIGKTVLVTTDNWFYAPNGCQYRAAFGTLLSIDTAEQTLGVKPNGRSTNWYLRIGKLVIAGCQVHYVLACDGCNLGQAADWTANDGKLNQYERPPAIFDADNNATWPATATEAT